MEKNAPSNVTVGARPPNVTLQSRQPWWSAKGKIQGSVDEKLQTGMAIGASERWMSSTDMAILAEHRSEVPKYCHDLFVAETAADRALKLDPNQPTALLVKGKLLLKEEKHEEALGHLERLLAIAPHHSEAWFLKGAIHLDIGMGAAAAGNGDVARELVSSAIHAYEQSLLYHDPSASPVRKEQLLCSKGLALMQLGRYEEAAQAFSEALRMDKQLAEAWTGLGNALAFSNNLADAVEAFQHALGVPNAMGPELWCNIGIILHDMGVQAGNLSEEQIDLFGKALEALEKAVELNPKMAGAWQCIEAMYLELGVEMPPDEKEAMQLAIEPQPADERQATGASEGQGIRDALPAPQR